MNFQKKSGGTPIGRILIDLGYVKESDLNIGLAAQKGYEWVELSRGMVIPPVAIGAVPAADRRDQQGAARSSSTRSPRSSTVVMANHENFRALDRPAQSMMGFKVTAKIGDADQIDKLIAKNYYQATAESLGDRARQRPGRTTRP